MTLATNILELFGKMLWGFKPLLMKDIVDIHGGWKSLSWFASNIPKYEKILKIWGAERTHAMAVAISGINGCPYCTYGHALSFQLHYYKNKQELFPIDEHDMTEFSAKNSDQIIKDLEDAYNLTGLFQEKQDLHRMIELKDHSEMVKDDNDNKIDHMVNVFAFLNSCGIEKKTKRDHASDPINKNTALYKEYQKARTSKNKLLEKAV